MNMAIGTDFFIVREALLFVLVGARFLIDSFTNFLLLIITFRLVNCVANVFMSINTNLKNGFEFRPRKNYLEIFQNYYIGCSTIFKYANMPT